jgi:hypothetical protein
MNSDFLRPTLRRGAYALALLGALAACQKNDASAGQLAAKADDAAQQVQQKVDEAASYVGAQVSTDQTTTEQGVEAASKPSITINPASLASEAQANLQSAASATQAAIGKAASDAGAGLQTAGQKLQQWGVDQTASASASASSSTSGESDAEKQMDK